MLGKDTDEFFPSGSVAHGIEIFGKSGRDIIKTQNKLGDIGVHRIRMSMDIVQRRIFDINRDIGAHFHFLSGPFYF